MILAEGPDEFLDGAKAVEHATRACELTGWRDLGSLMTLASAYARAGDFDKAVHFQRKAAALPDAEKKAGASLQERLTAFQKREPIRSPKRREGK